VLENKVAILKQCPCCSKSWIDRESLLNDPEIMLVGYQVNFDALQLGFFLFNHELCCTTLAIPVKHFLNLHSGPIYKERMTGEKECPGYCLYDEELDECPVKCECAYIRNLIQIIRQWPKAERVL